MLKKLIIASLAIVGVCASFVVFVMKIGKAYDEAIKDARL